MVQQIAVIDENGTQIGKTFPKRAKQLIGKQRALWQDETHTAICLLPELKEEIILDEDLTCKTSNGFMEASSHAKSNDLLLYLAKRRVKERKRLFKHGVAFIAAWPILIIFYVSFVNNARHPLAWRIEEAIWQLNNVSLAYDADIRVVEDTIWVMDYLNRQYVPPVWYLILGIMTVWGTWLATGCIKRAASRFQTRHVKKSKPDPVALEYQRLKDMASEGMELGKI